MPAFATPTFRRLRVLGLNVCLTVCLGGANTAWAERADRDKPLNAEADSLRYDDARQTSVFTGNVVITKGTIRIRGAQVEIRQDAQGNQFGVVTGSPGTFRQKRDGVDEHIEGEARRIDYDSRADTVRFTGDAVLRRYKGTLLNDETSGGVIVYNNATDTFTVDGADPARPTASGSSAASGGRVRAMLTPVPKPGAAPAAPPVATPPAALTPSRQIEGRP